MSTLFLHLAVLCSNGAGDESASPNTGWRRIAASIEAVKLVLTGKTIDDAIDQLFNGRVVGGVLRVPGGHYDYLKIAGTPLILSYRKDGTFAGVAPLRYSLSGVLNSGAERLLQGEWKASGVQMRVGTFGLPAVERIAYGMLIKDNICIPSGPTGLAGAPVFYVASRHRGTVFFQPGYPQIEDQAEANSCPVFWTVRRSCYPIGATSFLTLGPTADGFEISLWVKK